MDIVMGREALTRGLECFESSCVVDSEIISTFENKIELKKTWGRFCNIPQSIIVKNSSLSTIVPEYIWPVLGNKPCWLKTGDGDSVLTKSFTELKETMLSSSWKNLDEYLVQATVGCLDGGAIYCTDEMNAYLLGGYELDGEEVNLFTEHQLVHCRRSSDGLVRKIQQSGFRGIFEISLRIDLALEKSWVIGCSFGVNDAVSTWFDVLRDSCKSDQILLSA